MMVSSSVGELGTRRITIRRPSVDPTPIEASDRIDVASENSRGVPPASLKMYEPVRMMVGLRWASAIPARSVAERTDLKLWNCFGLELGPIGKVGLSVELGPLEELSPISNLATCGLLWLLLLEWLLLLLMLLLPVGCHVEAGGGCGDGEEVPALLSMALPGCDGTMMNLR